MSHRVLIKLRPGPALSLAAPNAAFRPLFDELSPVSTLGMAEQPSWYVADLPEEANPWDTAHRQVSAALGANAPALLFAEPDLQQEPFKGYNKNPPIVLPIAPPRNIPASPPFGWHLDDSYSQLRSARTATVLNRTVRIAHLDTGYDPNHSARPANILTGLERSFADDDGNPNRATDPNRRHLLDQSGHGTGTIGILAGPKINQAEFQDILGGAPDAEILPIRISNSVVLFWTSALAAGLQYAIAHKCDVISLSMGGLPSRA